MSKNVNIAVSDKSGLPDSESEGGGAVPSTAAILCEFCEVRPAKYYLPHHKKWCCAKRADACKGKPTPGICIECGKQHDGLYSKDFCSKSCLAKHNLNKGRNSEKLLAHYQDTSWRGNPGKGPYECNICHGEFDSKKKLRKHLIQEHGEKHYAKGLEWRNDPEKAERARLRMIETRKRKFATGELIATWTGKHHSKETREKISKAAVIRVLSETSYGRRSDVKWYSVKNTDGIECKNQGTWERDFAIWLTSQGIRWEKRKLIPYVSPDGVNKTYVPDFYLPNTDEYVEIKGLFSQEDKVKMNAVVSCNPQLRIFFVFGKKLLQDIICGNRKLDDDLLYKNS